MAENPTKPVRLHISGFPPALKSDDLLARFKSFGTVETGSVSGIGEKDANGDPKTFAFLTLHSTQSQLSKCLNLLSGSKYRGSTLRIAPAKNPIWEERLTKERSAISESESGKKKRKRKSLKGTEGKEVKDLNTLTTEKNWKEREGWLAAPRETSSKTPIFPLTIRPSHRLPSPPPGPPSRYRLLHPSSTSTSIEETPNLNIQKKPLTRARRVRIDPRRWKFGKRYGGHITDKEFGRLKEWGKGRVRSGMTGKERGMSWRAEIVDGNTCGGSGLEDESESESEEEEEEETDESEDGKRSPARTKKRRRRSTLDDTDVDVVDGNNNNDEDGSVDIVGVKTTKRKKTNKGGKSNSIVRWVKVSQDGEIIDEEEYAWDLVRGRAFIPPAKLETTSTSRADLLEADPGVSSANIRPLRDGEIENDDVNEEGKLDLGRSEKEKSMQSSILQSLGLDLSKNDSTTSSFKPQPQIKSLEDGEDNGDEEDEILAGGVKESEPRPGDRARELMRMGMEGAGGVEKKPASWRPRGRWVPDEDESEDDEEDDEGVDHEQEQDRASHDGGHERRLQTNKDDMEMDTKAASSSEPSDGNELDDEAPSSKHILSSEDPVLSKVNGADDAQKQRQSVAEKNQEKSDVVAQERDRVALGSLKDIFKPQEGDGGFTLSSLVGDGDFELDLDSDPLNFTEAKQDPPLTVFEPTSSPKPLRPSSTFQPSFAFPETESITIPTDTSWLNSRRFFPLPSSNRELIRVAKDWGVEDEGKINNLKEERREWERQMKKAWKSGCERFGSLEEITRKHESERGKLTEHVRKRHREAVRRQKRYGHGGGTGVKLFGGEDD